jgi:ribosomal-protein-alanine N-acetyltransferase
VAAPDLRGQRVLLRAARDSDRFDRLTGGRDLEFWRMVGGSGPKPEPLTASDVDRWYAAHTREPHAWIVDLDDHCIGTARLHDLDATGLHAWYAVGLFWRAHWGRGLGQEVTRLVLGYSFATLGLLRVKVRVLDFNQRAIDCYKRCGFTESYREPAQLGETVAVDIIMEARPDTCTGDQAG